MSAGAIASSYKLDSAPWTPASLASLYVWGEVGNPATITSSSGLASVVADQSGGSRDYVAASDANKPGYGTRTINGRNVLDFDGAFDRMDSSFTLTQPFTVAVVVAADVTNQTMVAVGRDSVATLRLGTQDTGVWRMFAGGNVSGGTVDTDPHLLVGIFDGASSVLRLDGGVIGTGNAGTADSPTSIGRAGTQGSWSGGIGDFVIASAALAGADLSNLEAYLMTLAGI